MSNATGQTAAMRTSSDADAASERSSSANHTSQDVALSPEQRSALREAVLHEMSPSERLFLVLRWCERMTLAEVGAVMDMTELQALRMQRLVLEMLGRHVPHIAGS